MATAGGRLVLVATLDVWSRAAGDFRRYEAAATEIMQSHGGMIERVIAVEEPPGDGLFSEIHIVSFPDREAFDNYRKDERLAVWMEVRSRAIAKTVIVFGANPSA